MTFDVGDVVECINDNWIWHEGKPTAQIPRVGEFFRITSIVPHRYDLNDIGIELKGLPRWYWEGSHFRKLEKGKDVFSLTCKVLEPA